MGSAEEWNHLLMLEREREAIEALNRCAAAGADEDALRTIAREMGIDIRYIHVDPSATSLGS